MTETARAALRSYVYRKRPNVRERCWELHKHMPAKRAAAYLGLTTHEVRREVDEFARARGWQKDAAAYRANSESTYRRELARLRALRQWSRRRNVRWEILPRQLTRDERVTLVAWRSSCKNAVSRRVAQ